MCVSVLSCIWLCYSSSEGSEEWVWEMVFFLRVYLCSVFVSIVVFGHSACTHETCAKKAAEFSNAFCGHILNG